jgi:hypothetical protein
VKLNWNDVGSQVSKIIIAKISAASLNLLKKNALNALLAVPILVVQKLINKNEKHPINSHPNNKVGKFPEAKSNIILTKKKNNSIIKLFVRGSSRI